MATKQSAVPGGNAPLLAAFLRALDAIQAAETVIDERGGGTESTYENLAHARSAIHQEIAALTLFDALGNLEARP